MNKLNENKIVPILYNSIKKDGYIVLPATGTSMFPLIKKGDICTFIKYESILLKKGGIALFYSEEGKLVAHRFFYVDEHNYYHFKGDANLGYDEPVTEEKIIGILTKIRRGNKVIRVNQPSLKIWGWIIQRTPILWDMLRNRSMMYRE